jgi:Co/Zn/Cd efflux system component
MIIWLKSAFVHTINKSVTQVAVVAEAIFIILSHIQFIKSILPSIVNFSVGLVVPIPTFHKS